MKNFSFRYYPPKVLIGIFIFVLALVVFVKWLIDTYVFEKQLLFWNFLFYLILSSSIVGTFFHFFNSYGLCKLTAFLLHIPDLRGTYEGKLTSSFYLDDDPQKPQITKFIRLVIFQNLNGFYVDTEISDAKNSSDNSSTSESFTHNIAPLENGCFLITYQYKNKPNKFHKDERTYQLNRHIGIVELVFNPKDKTLKGDYWNNQNDRKSYGKIELSQIE